MTINSIGSSFDYIPPAQAARETSGSARVAEASEISTDKTSSTASDWPPRLASEKLQERRMSTVYGRLVAAQEEATSRPRVSSQDAARAYAKGG